MNPDIVLGELEGLRALARSLVHGDADTDDLIQDTAIAATVSPPDDDGRPVRPWLATVLRNRWRMDRRASSRRVQRELAVAADATNGRDDVRGADELLDRARMLERLAKALVGLDEPFRTVVIRRYLDGKTAAQIAKELGVPPGTVRWRLKTGLERLRAALDESTPRWQLALAPFAMAKGVVAVKTKTTILSLVILLLLIAAGAIAVLVRGGNDGSSSTTTASRGGSAALRAPGGPTAQIAVSDASVPVVVTAPGQKRATIATVDAAGGMLSGRVINWSTGDGVANAELTFTSEAGASTIRTKQDGAFELSPAVPGAYELSVVAAQGFLPFAPELAHSRVRAELVVNQAVRDVTVFLFPAVPYEGTVVDGGGQPVAGARVKLAGTPQGEQAIEKLVAEWTTDKQGKFTFNAPDGAVFEATRGTKRGWARLTGDVALTHKMTITLGDAPARDASIRGKTIDAKGAPIAEVLIRAIPVGATTTPPSGRAPNANANAGTNPPGVTPQGVNPSGVTPPSANPPGTNPPGPPGEHTRSEAFALSGPDGTFVFEGLDRGNYYLLAELDEYAPVEHGPVAGGTHDVLLTLDGGEPITGRVETSEGEPVPVYTLLVERRDGLVRELVLDRAILDPRGRFSIRLPKGEFQLLANANGWAPSAPLTIKGGAKDVKIVLSAGATLTGVVVDADTGKPLAYARVMREGAGGGASAAPANAGTVTRTDGMFELAGIPAGPLSISIGAGDYNPRLESGLNAVEGGVLGPIRIPLKMLAEGEQPKIDLVGIGVKLSADKDALRVDMVAPSSGAADAGIVVGDQLVTVDGIPITQLGIDGAVAKIRGVAGTTLSIGLRRGDQVQQLVVTRKPLRF